jgi:hypothetical protein
MNQIYESHKIRLSCLVPEYVTWRRFCQFTDQFKDITDNEVSGRYHYGEIRLSRLNYYAPVLLGRSQYHRVNHQYRAYCTLLVCKAP